MRKLLTTLFVLSAMPVSAAEIIAHRGASYDAPENTLSSVKLAWERDADAVEFDVWLSKDGKVVLFHDKDTERIGGRKKLVTEQTYAELCQLDVGAWKDEKYRGERIPLIEDVLPTIPPGKRFFVEIKDGPEILPALKQAFDESGIDHEQLVIISFGYDVVTEAKKLFPDIPVYWLSSLKEDKETGEFRPSRDELIEKAKAAGVDGLDLQARPIIDAEYVQAVKDAGLGFYVWTVNDPAEAQRLIEAGAEGVTTDRPAYLKEELGLVK